MKKILLFMLPLVALSFASCEKDNGEELSGDDIIQFKDAHFLKALLIDHEIEMYDAERNDWITYLMDVDTNRDGQISVNEAKNVKGLELSYTDEETDEFIEANISEMSEIKYFTSLEYLDCEYNQLAALDLSNNISLYVLYCYNNHLKTLDVSKCVNLKELDCGENQLVSLDVSQNVLLDYLNCEMNSLTTLDISSNSILTALECDQNNLTTLDLNKNTALTFLNCSYNQLTSLDLSKNTALTYIDCSDNQLTTLDLSNNTALTELLCENNPLTKLILPRDHNISDYYMQQIIEEYGDIIEYV